MRIRSASNLVRRSARALCACVVLLAACGGGTSQIEPFEPRQLILLGDESTVLAADGKNYTINALTATNTINCNGLPIWTQSLATSFGMVVDRCNPNNLTARAVTRGAPGAKAADVEAQITAQFNAEAPTSKDLFVIMVGLNDIIDQFENFAGAKDCDPDPDRNRATPLERELRARGEQVAAQINRLAAADARVIVATVHDMGLTPYATTRNANALLTCLTASFNTGLRVAMLQDGRFIGLVLTGDLTQAIVNSPQSYGLANVSDAACAVALPDCTTSTLVSGATTGTHLWADDRHLGPVAHNSIASFAESRARNNPF
jgi:outer membrane lipase/esterase